MPSMRYEILCFDDFLKHGHWHPGGAILINHSELNAAPLTNDILQDIFYKKGEYFLQEDIKQENKFLWF